MNKKINSSNIFLQMDSFVRCLKEEAESISSNIRNISEYEVENTFNIIEKCIEQKSKIIFTGVGKSGIVARKIAATFSSVGLMSVYLNPLDAFHGDLGIVSNNDVCFLLSNSGETSELIKLIPHFKIRGNPCISIVGEKDSTLAKASDASLIARVNKEVCPLNLAPTASTAVAMAIGDALAVVWMERRNISQEDFAINHPGGILGKKLTLKSSHLMTPINKLTPIDKSTSLINIISKITSDGIGCCWVSETIYTKNILGLITDGDLLRSLKSKDAIIWDKLKAKDIMTKDPIIISHDLLAVEALKLMENNIKKSINVLPVINENQEMVGILRLHELIQAGIK